MPRVVWPKDNDAFEEDIPLLKELGLRTFMDLPARQETYLGCVRVGIARVWVFVEFVPSIQLWRFHIHNAGGAGRDHDLRSGSGYLSTYWPAVELIADDLLSIRYTGGG